MTDEALAYADVSDEIAVEHAGAEPLDRAKLASKGGGTTSEVLNFMASPAVSSDLARLRREIESLTEQLRRAVQQYAAAQVHALLAGIEDSSNG